MHICASSVIVDGLLCSIMKVLSNTNKDNELAWIKLFSFFRDVQDEQRKNQVIEIKRQSV